MTKEDNGNEQNDHQKLFVTFSDDDQDQQKAQSTILDLEMNGKLDNDDLDEAPLDEIHFSAAFTVEEAERIIGGKYTKREYMFVILVGVLLSFNCGYANGVCLSGLLDDRRASVAGVTGYYTNSALDLAGGDISEFGFRVSMLLSFIAGSFFSALMTPRPTPHRIEPTYGPTFIVGGILMMAAGIIAAEDGRSFFYFAAAASGVQNGMSSMYSANLIRTTHLTGTSTDIGLFAAQALRGNRENLWKLYVLICLATSFWAGGFISFYAAKHFVDESLLFSGGLFLLLGVGIIIFVVLQLHVSATAAMMGTWEWKKIRHRVERTLRMKHSREFRKKSERYKSQLYGSLNDFEMRSDHLSNVLEEAGIALTDKDVDFLMEKSGKTGDGEPLNNEELRMSLMSTVVATYMLRKSVVRLEDALDQNTKDKGSRASKKILKNSEHGTEQLFDIFGVVDKSTEGRRSTRLDAALSEAGLCITDKGFMWPVEQSDTNRDGEVSNDEELKTSVLLAVRKIVDRFEDGVSKDSTIKKVEHDASKVVDDLKPDIPPTGS